MSQTNKKRHKTSSTRLVALIPVLLILLYAYLIQGKNLALFNPKGYISNEQYKLMVLTIVVLLIIAIPSLFTLYFFVWKYRETNPKNNFSAETHYTKFFIFGLWVIPTAFMLTLAVYMWSATHRLVPQKTIAASTKPLHIKVVALQWKWLFIYPEQDIATINYLHVPIDTPLQIDLTADNAPMNSFWIPQLGGQLYAMTGHVNRLNLLAHEPGIYRGGAAEINGSGFAGMKFEVRAVTQSDFSQWVQITRLSNKALDTKAYDSLLKPTENHQVTSFSATDPNLYSKVLLKYNSSGNYMVEHKH